MDEVPSPQPHRRRPRYPGKNPRHFEQKYKEQDPARYRDTVSKVLASGKTPAGTHRPILVQEILEILHPTPGEMAVDCTLGYGGHAREILPRLLPGGKLFGLDSDPVEIIKTEKRLRELGFGPENFAAFHRNFAGLPTFLAEAGLTATDMILADLGVSSMQLDDPARGFSLKHDGPLDMRMNPQHGRPAFALLRNITAEKLSFIFQENADEPHAEILATGLAGGHLPTTLTLAARIRQLLPRLNEAERELSVRRVFQALRIEINDEFSALETFLRHLPGCLSAGGRAAILTFHSGEDRRVKKAFEKGIRAGDYAEISKEVIRPGPEEQRMNPRSKPAKLRWAKKNSSAE